MIDRAAYAIQSAQQAAQGAETLANTDIRDGSALEAVNDMFMGL